MTKTDVRKKYKALRADLDALDKVVDGVTYLSERYHSLLAVIGVKKAELKDETPPTPPDHE